MTTLTSDTIVLGLTLYGEARGEPIESIIAVGCVIRNRLMKNFKYKSYSDVCLEPYQFSCWNENDPNSEKLLEYRKELTTGGIVIDSYLRQCLFLAEGIINYILLDNTRGSLHYVATKILNNPPSWALRRTNEIVKGNHTFFNI